ncbi:MAG: S9 family peptidase [Wenzhouxiangella sp.]|nr:MAG: S9 family peptidase [Wenzhouxiangella sp.]
MTRLLSSSYTLALLLLLVSIASAETPRPITHEDLWLMPRVGTPVVSPDGRLAVVAVNRPAYDSDDQASHLWLVQVDGSATPRQLTFSDASESQVTWAPDSSRIAFVARRDGDDASQVYLLDLVAGGEARRITSISTGARQPRFSPDGQRIAFTSNVHPDSQSDEDSRRISEEREARKYNVLTYTGFPIRNWNTWLNEFQPRVFVQTIGAEQAVDLLAGTELVASPGYDGRRTAGGVELDVTWTPDGEGLVFVASRNRDRFAFDSTHTDLWLVAATGGEPRRLTGSGEPAGSDNYGNPRFSADGRLLLAQRTPRTEWVYNATDLVVLNWPQAEVQAVIELPERRAVAEYALAPDGDSVFILAEDAGLVRLYRASTSGGVAAADFDQQRGIYTGLDGGGDAGSGVLLARYESASEPAEIVQLLPGQGHARLTEFTAEAVAGLDLPELEHFWFDNDDGVPIHSMLVRPAGFDPNRSYPLLVLMHGGPHIMYRDYFFLRWNYHLLAGTDYVLVLTNYSGSTGFGEEFARRIQGDPLRGPAIEINQAADVAIEQFGFINGERQCAGGASYGGHLANWMQGATDRYRCLISHAGLVNLITQWGTSDAVYHREANLGAPPWEDPQLWLDQNPLMYAENWQTPVLVTIGKKDERVPLANVLEYWTALQRQQVESRLLVYPDEDHWIMSGHNSRHFYGEIADWLARWLKD